MKFRHILTSLLIVSTFFMTYNIQAKEYTGHNGAACTSNCSNFTAYMQYFPKDPNAEVTVYVSTGGTTTMKAGDYINQPGIFTQAERDAWAAGKTLLIQANQANGAFFDRDDTGGRRNRQIEGMSPENSAKVMNLVADTKEGFDRDGRTIVIEDDAWPDDVPKPTGTNDQPAPEPELPPGHIRCDIDSGPSSVPATPIPAEINVSGTYAVQLTLVPVKPLGFEKLTPEQQAAWEATHHSQTVGPYLTPYGEFLESHQGEIDALQGQPDSAWQSMQAQIEAAIATPYNLETLVLDDANLQGIQTGGAYTITEHTKEVALNVQKETEQYDIYGCIPELYETEEYERDPETGGYVKDKETGYFKTRTVQRTRTRYGYKGRESGETYVTSIKRWDNGGWTPKNSYQIITVRCNASELAKIVASTGSSIYSGSTTASSSAKSPTVGGSIASFFNDLTIEFFYEGKDCENNIPCVVGETITDKPTNENGGGNGNGKETYFGTESKGIRSDHFTFFRDNVSNLVINDVWTPNISKIYRDVVVKEATPNGTYLTLSKDGTPKGDLFNIEDVNNNVILSGDKFPTINYYVARQKENQFNWKASWATDQEHPHKANIKYGYRLHVITTVPTLNASGIVGTSTYSDKFIDLFCHTTFNSNAPKKPIVYNKPDEYNYKPFTEFDDTKGRYVTIDFVKTSAE